MCAESFGDVRFDLGALFEGQMWYFIPIMVYISLICGLRHLRCEDNLQEIMCPKSFSAVKFALGALLQG